MKKGVSYELTVLHLSLTGVECLVDNVSLKDSPWGSFERNSVYF